MEKITLSSEEAQSLAEAPAFQVSPAQAEALHDLLAVPRGQALADALNEAQGRVRLGEAAYVVLKIVEEE